MDRRGFTLIEVMTVIAIVATLSAMAVPILLAARASANEKATLWTLRSLVTAEQAYFDQSDVFARPASLRAAGLLNLGGQELDAAAGRYAKGGFEIDFGPDTGPMTGWNAVAWPQMPGIAGRFSYYVDQRAAIRFRAFGEPTDPKAGPADPAL